MNIFTTSEFAIVRFVPASTKVEVQKKKKHSHVLIAGFWFLGRRPT
jgi:hypothetical protein